MKKFKLDSDIGSVLVGNEQVQFALPNIGGDGTTTLLIYNSTQEYDKVREERQDKFVTCIQGTFNVFNYDCSDGNKEDVVITLQGRYGVYNNDYTVILVRWE